MVAIWYMILNYVNKRLNSLIVTNKKVFAERLFQYLFPWLPWQPLWQLKNILLNHNQLVKTINLIPNTHIFLHKIKKWPLKVPFLLKEGGTLIFSNFCWKKWWCSMLRSQYFPDKVSITYIIYCNWNDGNNNQLILSFGWVAKCIYWNTST